MLIDLSAIPVVDNHCHALFREQALDLTAWRGRCTESAHDAMVTEHAPSTLFYTRLVRELARFLGCAEEDVAVVAARQERPADELVRALLADARIDALLIDTGLPSPEVAMPLDRIGLLGDCGIGPMLRLEIVMQELVVMHGDFATVREAFAERLRDIRGQGYVALKSIAAYRTGLDITTWDQDEVAASFAEARRTARDTGKLRIAHKPLLDTLLHVAFAAASAQEVPIQFHVGYGDADANLLKANPLHLREVLQNDAYRGMSVVLLHECWPYTREGGYLAAVYENVYLDLSYGIPFLSLEEMATFTRAALGVAPLSKLFYSSDAVGIPEVHWLSAHTGRRIIGEALGASVDTGDLNMMQAERAGEQILRGNARRVYRL